MNIESIFLEKVKLYINKHYKRPSSHSKDIQEKRLGQCLSDQKKI